VSTHRFGTIERVAFDIDVEPDEQRLGIAFLTLWAGGARLGATDRTEQLETFLQSLARFVDALPVAPPELAALPAAAAFKTVHGLLTDADPNRPDFPWDRSSLYQRLPLLPNNCAPFDGDWAVLLREPARDRLIVRAFEDPRVHEVVLDAGEVESVARAVLAHPWRGP
jgi:hypothetical protein